MVRLSEGKAPIFTLPKLDLKDEFPPWIDAIEQRVQIPEQTRKDIRNVLSFYVTNGNPNNNRAEQLFRDPIEHSKLIEKLDFLEQFTAIDEVVTNFDIRELSRLRQKVDFVKQKILETRNFFSSWFDPTKFKICHKDKLEALYLGRGYPMIARLVNYILMLVDSYEKLAIQRAMDDFKEMQIKRIESTKIPENVKVEPPDAFAEGDKELIKEIEQEELEPYDNHNHENDEAGEE